MADVEIKQYLSYKSETLVLPEKSPKEPCSSYPFLILDGASGVGKTQQAFGLLSSSKAHLIYLNLAPHGGGGGQAIYRQMEMKFHTHSRVCGADFAKIDAVIKELHDKKPESENQQDEINSGVLSMTNLSLQIGRSSRLQQLQKDLESSLLTYESTTGQLKLRVSDSELDGQILFIDEAFPLFKHGDVELLNKCVSRTRLLRNLGRVLGMRVVVAGTGATKVTMLCDKLNPSSRGLSASREDDKFVGSGWAVVHPLWHPLKVFGIECRPWVAQLAKEHFSLHNSLDAIEEEGSAAALNDEDWMTFFYGMIGSIKGAKAIGSNHFSWISGAWLEGSFRPPSPYLMAPTELVRRHLFEPAISVWGNDSKGQLPYTGRGFGPAFPKAGPLRVFINRSGIGDGTRWVVSTSPNLKQDRPVFEAGVNYKIVRDFNEVGYTFSQCVQQCLVREPLLAVALSLYKPEENKDLRMLEMSETASQRSVGAADGELHEHICFAALQQARNICFGEPQNALDFIKALEERLVLQHDSSDEPEVVSKLPVMGLVKEAEKRTARNTGDLTFDANVEQMLKGITVPWMVPACSEERLRDMLTTGDRHKLFGGLDIAGLVAGRPGAPFDMISVDWKQGAPVSWRFEIKIRPSGYTVTNAWTDLKKKIANDNKPHRSGSHAMLICATDKKKSEIYVQYLDAKVESLVSASESAQEATDSTTEKKVGAADKEGTADVNMGSQDSAEEPSKTEQQDQAAVNGHNLQEEEAAADDQEHEKKKQRVLNEGLATRPLMIVVLLRAPR